MPTLLNPETVRSNLNTTQVLMVKDCVRSSGYIRSTILTNFNTEWYQIPCRMHLCRAAVRRLRCSQEQEADSQASLWALPESVRGLFSQRRAVKGN